MPYCSTRGAWLVLLAGSAVVLSPATVTAVDPTPAAFQTVDDVKLKGDFYPGQLNKPSILLVTRIGGKRSEEGWKQLAEFLSGKGYAVLSFDLRGCGESTRVGSRFWNDARFGAVNQAGIRGRRKEQISFKEFRPSYFAWMANDLSAAKSYLDQQNNARSCNSSDIIVIAAESGAALSALWVAAEWRQLPYQQSPLVPTMVMPVTGAKPLGNDVAAAIWLTMPRSVKWSNRDSVFHWLTGRVHFGDRTVVPLAARLPMAFVWGKEDTSGNKSATELLKELGRLNANGKTIAKLAKDPLPGKGMGAQLLGKQQLNTEKFIKEVIDNVMDERGPTPWRARPDALMPIEPTVLRDLGARLS